MVPRPAAAALPGTLLEMQILEPTLYLMNEKFSGKSPNNLIKLKNPCLTDHWKAPRQLLMPLVSIMYFYP